MLVVSWCSLGMGVVYLQWGCGRRVVAAVVLLLGLLVFFAAGVLRCLDCAFGGVWDVRGEVVGLC